MKDEYPLPFQAIKPDPTSSLQKFEQDPSPIILLLDGMEDPRNLGAIFRLADAARIAHIYAYQTHLSSQKSKIESVSRQTIDHIAYKELGDLDDVISLTERYYPIALEYTNKSIPFKNYQKAEPCMLVIGSERRGVSKELLSICKTSLHVPMLGQNSSMNVTVATGIVVYHLLGNMGRFK